jgi:hypothetical protein
VVGQLGWKAVVAWTPPFGVLERAWVVHNHNHYDVLPRTHSFKHAGRCFRCAVDRFFARLRTPVVDQSSSVYLSSLSRILPYGSRGDVESDDSHPALIPVPALVRIVVSSDYGCGSYVTLRHHAIPRPALHRLFVVAIVVVIAAR